MQLTINGQAITDLEDYINVDHVKDLVNICTDIPTPLEEGSFRIVMAKAINALNRNVRDYGWELGLLHIDIENMTVNILEDGILTEKMYNEETDNWE